MRPLSASARSVRVFSELNPEPRDIEGCGHWSPSAGAPGAPDIRHGHEPGNVGGDISKHMSSLCLRSDHCNNIVCSVSLQYYFAFVHQITMSMVLLIETALSNLN